MDTIKIRYGESLTLPIDTMDPGAVSADIFIGKAGEVYTLTQHISLTDGQGVFEFSDSETKIPLDTYYYQINTEDASGKVEKYPSPDCDSCEFPKFIVCEALDEIEVS